MLNVLIGFMLAWTICGIILYANDSRIMCPDKVFLILSLPMQILSIPYYLIKTSKKK